MFNTHVCDCGLCWESEKHGCEMRYRSAVRSNLADLGRPVFLHVQAIGRGTNSAGESEGCRSFINDRKLMAVRLR